MGTGMKIGARTLWIGFKVCMVTTWIPLCCPRPGSCSHSPSKAQSPEQQPLHHWGLLRPAGHCHWMLPPAERLDPAPCDAQPLQVKLGKGCSKARGLPGAGCWAQLTEKPVIGGAGWSLLAEYGDPSYWLSYGDHLITHLKSLFSLEV